MVYMATKDLNDMCVVCMDGEDDPPGIGPFEYVRTAVRYGTRYKEYRCVDRKACARREAQMRRELADAVLDEIRMARENLTDLRRDVVSAEARVATQVREALKEGVGATAIARAAGLSRERVYQIRDGRR